MRKSAFFALLFLAAVACQSPATAESSPSEAGALDLAAIVIPPASPPRGMTFSGGERGQQVLDRLPLFADTAAQLKAQSGFVDGRSTSFAGSTGFVLTWVVQYASPADAMGAFSILRRELESDDHYGWGAGTDAGLGDEGTCLEGDNPQLDGLHETICAWRHGSLVMVVGGGSGNETPIQTVAEAVEARAEVLVR